MITLFALIAGVLIIATLTIFLTMTTYDMRIIQANRRVLRLRRQPLVSIVIDDMITDDSLKSISKRDYRKYEIVFAGEPVKGDMILILKPGTVLPPKAIRQSVQQLQSLKNSRFVEMKPMLVNPTNLLHLFRVYYSVATAPFISVRAQLNIRPLTHSKWSVMQWPHIIDTWQTYAYYIGAWLLSLANTGMLLYFVYLSAWLSQPDLLLLYIGAFWLWLIVSIWDYPHFSIKQKLSYTALAPVSFIYFLFLAITVPLTIPLRIGMRVLSRFFSRSVHQTVA